MSEIWQCCLFLLVPFIMQLDINVLLVILKNVFVKS